MGRRRTEGQGYDDPGDHGTLDIANAGFTNRASVGATALTAFATGGLQLGTNQSLSIVAHSYGSVVTGVALANDGLKPTNVVTAGSPGMTVDDIGALHLKPGQFYAEQAPKDYVANNFGGFGNDPTSPDFGGARLKTNGPGYQSVSAHGDYFNYDTQQPGVDDDLGAAARTQFDPAGPALDWFTRHYDGPDAGVVQAVDHLSNATANNVDAGVRDGTDVVESGAKKVWGWVS